MSIETCRYSKNVTFLSESDTIPICVYELTMNYFYFFPVIHDIIRKKRHSLFNPATSLVTMRLVQLIPVDMEEIKWGWGSYTGFIIWTKQEEAFKTFKLCQWQLHQAAAFSQQRVRGIFKVNVWTEAKETRHTNYVALSQPSQAWAILCHSSRALLD